MTDWKGETKGIMGWYYRVSKRDFISQNVKKKSNYKRDLVGGI